MINRCQSSKALKSPYLVGPLGEVLFFGQRSIPVQCTNLFVITVAPGDLSPSSSLVDIIVEGLVGGWVIARLGNNHIIIRDIAPRPDNNRQKGKCDIWQKA